MALPTLSKTWIFNPNIICPTNGSGDLDPKYLHFAIKKALTTASGWTDASGSPVTNDHPWSVLASSDAVTANTSDLWTDATKVTAPNSTHFSWVVLNQPAINPNFQIAFGCDSNSYSAQGYWMHFGTSFSVGFTLTGLSVAAYPTGSDVVTVMTNQTGYGQSSSAFDGVLHCMMSTDGQCTRVIFCSGGAVRVLWVFDKPKNPVSGWTNPAIASVVANTSAVEGVYGFYNVGMNTNAWWNGGQMGLYWTSEYYATTPVGSAIPTWNQISQEWPAIPVGLASATPGKYGRHGEIYDIWWSGSGSITPGDTFPSTGTRSMVCLGNLIVPWNGSDFLAY